MVTVTSSSYAILGSLTLASVDDSGTEWILESVSGWGSPSGTLQSVQKTRQSGSWAGSSFMQARPVELAGHTVAVDADAASLAVDQLISAASLDSTRLTVVESGRSRWTNVRRDGEVLIEWISTVAFSWSVQFVALDPRKFADSVSGQTSLPSTTGGLTVPFTLPTPVNAVTVSGQVNLSNPGNDYGPVVVRIDGPCVGPVITHVGSGLSLTFASSLTLGAGEFLTVDMERREVLANGQSSRNGFVTSRGWSQFEPGNNTWAFTAASYDAGSLLTVTATPSWK